MDKRKPVAPQFGNWDEDVHYTTYFEKAARPTTNATTPPNPNQTADQTMRKRPTTAASRGDINAADHPRRRGPDPRTSSSQRSTASESQIQGSPSSSRGQFRPSAITWELRNTKTDEMIPRNYDDAASRHNYRGGRGGEVVGAAAAAAPIRNLPYEGQRYGSAPATPQHGYGYGTPNEIRSEDKGGVPKFGVWNVDDSAISDGNYTQVFEKMERGRKDPEKQQQPPMPRQPIRRPPADPKPRTTQPTFLPEVPRRVTPPKSPSYDLVNNNAKAKKSPPRCWPFRFSFK